MDSHVDKLAELRAQLPLDDADLKSELRTLQVAAVEL